MPEYASSVAIVATAKLGHGTFVLHGGFNPGRVCKGKSAMSLSKLFQCALAGVLTIAGGSAVAQSVKLGTLTCDVSAGLGMIVTSQREIVCTFAGSNHPPEVYAGFIRRFGLDLGATTAGQLVWAVVAPAAGPLAPGALAGSYVGASAGATVGAGLGANILVGGGPRSFALQPLSMEGQAGLSVAAGVADLELRPAQLVR
jgi:hypothetical protein